MDELEAYLETDIPEDVMLLSLVALCVVVMLVMALCRSFAMAKKGVQLALLMEYVAMVFCSTVLYRQTSEEPHYELHPFYSYGEVYDTIFWQVLLNVVLFVPIGLLLGGLTKGWWRVIVCSCGLSICIEVLQLVFRKGLCETDDVIHNTLGAIFGLAMYRTVSWFWKRYLRHGNSRVD